MTEIRRIRLNIREKNGCFQALVSSDLQRDELSIHINLDDDDLRGWNEELTDILTASTRKVKHMIDSEARISTKAGDSVCEEFRWLAERAAVCLVDIFGDQGLELLRKLIGNAPKVILEIVSKSFVVPWELLYDHYEPTRFDYENFWGFKYIIYRHIPPDDGRYVPSPEIEIGPAFVGVLADPDLPSVANMELPFLRTLEKERLIKLLLPSKELHSTRRDRSLDTVKRFFEQDMHIIHFACHTRPPSLRRKEPRDEYLLLLSKNVPLARSDLITRKMWFGDYPLVILNACGTSPRNPLKLCSTVQTLLKRNARGVVTTECVVPDAFAAAFTQQFYPLLLRGQELGSALFETRKALLKDPYHNPLGLLYALYAFPHTHYRTDS
jgi:hypothetical protein